MHSHSGSNKRTLSIRVPSSKSSFPFFPLNQINFVSKICTEFGDSIVPPSHPYYYRVKKVANRLLSANRHMPQIYTKTWTVTVLDDPKQVNAFVLPVVIFWFFIIIWTYLHSLVPKKNGNIFVFSGMLNMCANDDELGAVLGHEIAHCLLGHAVSTLLHYRVSDYISSAVRPKMPVASTSSSRLNCFSLLLPGLFSQRISSVCWATVSELELLTQRFDIRLQDNLRRRLTMWEFS